MAKARQKKKQQPPPDSESDQSPSDPMEDDEMLSDQLVDDGDGLEDDDNMDEDDDELEDEEEDDDEEEEEEEEEEEDEEEEEEEEEEAPAPRKSRSTRRKRGRDAVASDEDDEEDDFLEVVRNKPMTKRQRAKMNQDDANNEDLLELPMDTSRKLVRSEEEEALRRSEVARRRKNQSIQRAEKDKQDILNRLLKKQASKSKKDEANDQEQPRRSRHADPHAIRYVQHAETSTLSIPDKHTQDAVFAKQKASPPKKQLTCQVKGCVNLKKYTAKSSGKAVCSLDHYKLLESQ